MNKTNLSASVRARLFNLAKERQQEFNLVLTRFAIERLLYRISISAHADAFLLKGALLFDLWFDEPHRPTRDADLLGFGSAELPHLEAMFKALCAIDVPDGMVYQAASVRAVEIRKEAQYDGVRVTLLGLLDGARCQVQVDIGFGDAVTPGPLAIEYPAMLADLGAPKLKAYPHYTVVAEKLEAICKLGMTNTRMKDYFDLWTLAKQSNFEGHILHQALTATFARRGCAIPQGTPLGLSLSFCQAPEKQMQWRAFLNKNRLGTVSLEAVFDELNPLLLPVVQAMATDAQFALTWRAGGPWV